MSHWRIGKPEDKCQCPRCGENNAALWNDTGTNVFWMECLECKSSSPRNSAFGAVHAWRPKETTQILELDRTEAESLLATFSPQYPMVVTPAYYQKLKDAGLSLKNVVEGLR